MNFHPDKQLFQVAGSGERTTDPWITKPAVYLYTMGDPLPHVLINHTKMMQAGVLLLTLRVSCMFLVNA